MTVPGHASYSEYVPVVCRSTVVPGRGTSTWYQGRTRYARNDERSQSSRLIATTSVLMSISIGSTTSVALRHSPQNHSLDAIEGE